MAASTLILPKRRSATRAQPKPNRRARRAAPDPQPTPSRAATIKIQPRLEVGEPNDRFEQEADRVADEVMRMPEPGASAEVPGAGSAASTRIQRRCGETDEDTILQGKEISGRTPEVSRSVQARIDGLRGRGQPLPASVRAFFEPRFGIGLSGVRIHAGSEAAESARALEARAFTLGRNVVFAAGQYAPRTRNGQYLLAHELAHVVQQGEVGQPAPPVQGPGSGTSRRGGSGVSIQRQAFPGCTPATTARPISQDATDRLILDSIDGAITLARAAIEALDAIIAGNATAAQQAALTVNFGTLAPVQVGRLRGSFVAMHRRLVGHLLHNPEVVCNRAATVFCARGWCAYTLCQQNSRSAVRRVTHLCPPWFQDPRPCAEPSRADSFLHEAGRAAGACGNDRQPGGAGYPLAPFLSMSNVFAYTAFARAVSPP